MLAIEPSINPVTQQAFRDLLTPPTGAKIPFIQENQAWVQNNLAHADKPSKRPSMFGKFLVMRDILKEQCDMLTGTHF